MKSMKPNNRSKMSHLGNTNYLGNTIEALSFMLIFNAR